MTKQQLLKHVHFRIWNNDDNMSQDDLFDLQNLIDEEIIAEAKKGTMAIKQHRNGYIYTIKIRRKE